MGGWDRGALWSDRHRQEDERGEDEIGEGGVLWVVTALPEAVGERQQGACCDDRGHLVLDERGLCGGLGDGLAVLAQGFEV